jgi:hypothetical protein
MTVKMKSIFKANLVPLMSAIAGFSKGVTALSKLRR